MNIYPEDKAGGSQDEASFIVKYESGLFPFPTRHFQVSQQSTPIFFTNDLGLP